MINLCFLSKRDRKSMDLFLLHCMVAHDIWTFYFILDVQWVVDNGVGLSSGKCWFFSASCGMFEVKRNLRAFEHVENLLYINGTISFPFLGEIPNFSPSPFLVLFDTSCKQAFCLVLYIYQPKKWKEKKRKYVKLVTYKQVKDIVLIIFGAYYIFGNIKMIDNFIYSKRTLPVNFLQT